MISTKERPNVNANLHYSKINFFYLKCKDVEKKFNLILKSSQSDEPDYQNNFEYKTWSELFHNANVRCQHSTRVGPIES